MTCRRRILALVATILCSASVAVAQTPGAPGNLQAADTGGGAQSLTWTAPTSGGPPSGYIVQIGTASGASDVLNQQIGNVTTYPIAAGALAPGTYFVRVRAFNAIGISEPSNELTLTITCSAPGVAPSHVTWRASATALQITWTPVSFVSDHQVEVGSAPGLSDVAVALAGSGTRSFLSVAVPGPGTYYVRVRAVRTCGVGPGSPELTVVAAALAPSTSIVVNEFNTFVELKNISTVPVAVAGWRIHTTTGAEQTPTIAAVLSPSATIAPGCTYLLAVEGDPLTAGVAADHPLLLAIADGVAVVRPDGFIIDAAGRLTSAGAGQPDTPYLEGQGLTPRSSSAGIESFARAGDQDTDNNAADFVPLATANPQDASSCLAGQPPHAPSQLAAIVNGSTVTLTWMAPVTGGVVLQYRLEAGSAPGASDIGVFDLSGQFTSITFNGVPNATFFVRLRALNTTGVSGVSNEVVVTVCDAGCSTPPGQATQLTFQISGSNVLLQWQAPASGAPPDGYLVEAGTGPGLANLAVFPTGSTSVFVIVSSVPPGTYYVRVRAVAGGTPGAASNEVVIVVQ